MSTLLLFFCLHLSSVSFLFQLFVRFIAIMTTAVVANPYLLIVVFVLMFVFFFLRWYYLQTAREVKRLEAVGNDNYTKRFLVSVVILECFCVIYLLSLQARSPLYSHISMTIHGLPTIRAYCRQGQSIDQFHTYHNKHTQGWDAYLTTSRWLEPIIDYEFHTIWSYFKCFFLPGGLVSVLMPSVVFLSHVWHLSLFHWQEVSPFSYWEYQSLSWTYCLPRSKCWTSWIGPDLCYFS